MKPIKKIMTLVVFLFSLCFPLASCQKQYRFDFSEEGWTIDNKQYLNYERVYHFEEDQKKDYYDIDFLNDVFPNGILIDQEGKRYNLKDEYETVVLLGDRNVGRTDDFEHQYLSPFKIRLFTFGVIVNSKTKTISSRMRLGQINFASKHKNPPVHIKTISDFKKLTGAQIAYLDNDIDFTGYEFGDGNPSLFPLAGWVGSFINPDKHVLKNITYTVDKAGYHNFITRNIFGSWFDSLIIDNFRYINNVKETGNDNTMFSIICAAAYASYFVDCKLMNINLDGNDFNLAAFSNTAFGCDFINCEVNGQVMNHYVAKAVLKADGSTKPGICARTSGFCNYINTVYTLGKVELCNAIKEYQEKPNKENLEKLILALNITPVVSLLCNNKIFVDARGYGKTGGISTCIDRINLLFINNIYMGTLSGKIIGEIYAENFFYQSDDYFTQFLDYFG